MLFNFYNKILNNKKLSIFLIALLFIIPVKSNAATVSVVPSVSTVSVGNIVTVSFVVNTNGVSVNNAEASIEYPTDLLEAVSANKSSSIFSLWVEEPKFSNSTGKITYNGGIATPGYTGSSGTMAQITFKAKKAGIASILFTDASVRANDGLGTNVLYSKNSGTIQIGIAKELEVPPTVTEKSLVPEKPIITSVTHPNQDIWYSNSTGTFEWKVPSGVTSIQTLINKIENSTPTITYDNSVSQKTINNLNEGTYYFHIRFANAKGWGKITHYRVNVDTIAPEPFAPEIRNDGSTNYILLNAKDATSGVSYYTISIDNNNTIKVKASDLINKEFALPAQNEGNHSVKVFAYDMAGNSTSADLNFVGSNITSPELALSTDKIVRGESITINGSSDYPNEKVKVTLLLDNKQIGEYIQKVSPDGTFSIVTNRLNIKGIVNIYGVNLLSDTISSKKSENLYLKVDEKTIVMVSFAAVWIIIVLLLVIILLLILYIGWHKYFGLRKKIEKESKDTIINVHKEMFKLKEELSKELLSLEEIKLSKNLNKKEEKIFDGIKKSIDDIDDFIEKKLRKLM